MVRLPAAGPRERDEDALNEILDKRGLFARVLAPLLRRVAKPWHIFPIGLLFGLGFDTASEVALLVLAGNGATSGTPWYGVLILPVLFAAGMTLMDTLDGIFMGAAYGWRSSRSLTKGIPSWRLPRKTGPTSSPSSLG